MDRVRLPQESRPYLEDTYWKVRWPDAPDAQRWSEPVLIGPATGPTALTENEAQRIAWKNLLSAMQQNSITQQSKMTIANFVETKFVPEHVATKMPSSQAYYQNMLKHLLTPEEVGHVFRAESRMSRKRLEADPDWPYLSQVRLCDVQPDHVRRLTAAALDRGYSTHTVKHIRNVMSTIFSHAMQSNCYRGENPVSLATLPRMNRREAQVLTSSQAKEAIRLMKHPEKEMTLMAVFTDLNMSEIGGLQWKHVNLTEIDCHLDGEQIPPFTIAVRKHWYRDRLGSVKGCRLRNLQIPKPLLQLLSELRGRRKFTGPGDFVFASRLGTPVNQTNTVERKLKPLGRQLGMPSLSWQLICRTRKTLASELTADSCVAT